MRFFAYLPSALFFLIFGLALLIFDVLQRFAYLIGYQAHHRTVVLFNGFCLALQTLLLGTRFKVEGRANIAPKKPIIFVANHQSMWDIPPLIWYLRSWHPKFISKKALGKGIPTISFNLKYGGSVLIDRNDSEQAQKTIKKVAKYISAHNRSVVIFPEGTRSKTGILKPFKRKGLDVLLEFAPEAQIIPLRITNSWKLQKYGSFPLGLGVKFKVDVLPEIKRTTNAEVFHESLYALFKTKTTAAEGS